MPADLVAYLAETVDDGLCGGGDGYAFPADGGSIGAGAAVEAEDSNDARDPVGDGEDGGGVGVGVIGDGGVGFGNEVRDGLHDQGGIEGVAEGGVGFLLGLFKGDRKGVRGRGLVVSGVLGGTFDINGLEEEICDLFFPAFGDVDEGFGDLYAVLP